jgi:diaminohydroxyphosphoribosylaminopyrimidine deaminase/5-amino-6-(5-phosphoribosylamino)uracil reductase
MVGIGTVLADDPALTSRMNGGRNPVRVVLDSRLQVPLRSRLLQDLAEARTILATTQRAPARKIEGLQALGAEVWILPEREGRVELAALMKRLAGEEIMSLLVEGGSRLAGALLREGYVDKLLLFLAPKLMGGEDGKPMFEGKGAVKLSEAIGLTGVRWRRIGEDFMIEGIPRRPLSPGP